MTRLPTSSRRRGGPGVPRAWYLAIVGMLGLLAACSTFGGVVETQDALEQAGFSEVDVSFNTSDGFDELDVTVDPTSVEGDGGEVTETAAGVVWTTFRLSFDELYIVLSGPFQDYETYYTADELQDLFGPRPPGFDQRSIGDDVSHSGLVIGIVVGGSMLLFGVAVVVAIILIVRASRRRAATQPPSWPPGSSQSPWPPQPQWPPQPGAQQPGAQQPGAQQPGVQQPGAPPTPGGWGSPPPSGSGPSWPPPAR